MREAIEKIAKEWLEAGLHPFLEAFMREHFTLVISALLVVGAAALIWFWIGRKNPSPDA